MILGRCLARNARLSPRKVALRAADGRSWTYEALNERVNRLANALLAHGIARGKRVAILDRNGPEYLETYFAAGMVGAWLVAINFQLKPADIAYRLEHSGAGALFVGTEFLPLVRALPPAVLAALEGRVWVIGEEEKGYPGYEALLDEGAAVAPGCNVEPEDVLYVGYTSGTTGSPKGALVSHRAIVGGYLYKALDYGLGAEDVSLCPGPFWHSAPRDFASLALYLGGTCVVIRGFDAAEYAALVERYRVSYSFMVPTMLQMLAAADVRHDLSSLRVLISGGSPLPTPVKRRVLEQLGPILHEFYGATETRIITSISARELEVKKRSVGRAIRDVELCILDEARKAVPVGTVGEVFVRGPGLFSGYLDDPERTRNSHHGDWFSLGDVGRQDEEGFLYLVDRKQDTIISGGENIYPNEVEEVLLAYPGVREAAVIGVPDPKWGELVTAIVVPHPGVAIDPKELIAFCGERLPGYMKPRRVDFVESLPRNAVGKILRRVLREPHWKSAEANI
jgi:acyl-CoA synthetase (AMP-forming)/AMP-acid ligase II